MCQPLIHFTEKLSPCLPKYFMLSLYQRFSPLSIAKADKTEKEFLRLCPVRLNIFLVVVDNPIDFKCSFRINIRSQEDSSGGIV
jgi:hypothetical protein